MAARGAVSRAHPRRAEDWRRWSRSATKSCRPFTTCSKGARRKRRWCTSTGPTTYLSTEIDADFEAAKAKAKRSVTRELHGPPGDEPLEGAAHRRMDAAQLVVTSSTSNRISCAPALPSASAWTRSRSRHRPRFGGGFGYKGIRLGEEVALSWGARKLGRPLRWLEDRRENLPREPIAGSITMSSPPMPMRTGASWRWIARRASMRAPIRPIRSWPVSKPARSQHSSGPL